MIADVGGDPGDARRRVERDALAPGQGHGEPRELGHRLGWIRNGLGLGCAPARQPRLLGAHHAPRDRQPQHVGRGSRRTVGDGPRQAVQPVGQDDGIGDDGVDLGEHALGVGLLAHLDDVALQHAARALQRHFHTHPRTCAVCERRGDLIVEEPIELRERRVDEDARNRPRSARGEMRRMLGHGPYSPTAARSASTRSSFSHVNSGSSRPKWP